MGESAHAPGTISERGFARNLCDTPYTEWERYVAVLTICRFLRAHAMTKRSPRRFTISGYEGGTRVYDEQRRLYVGKVFDRPEKAQQAANQREKRLVRGE